MLSGQPGVYADNTSKTRLTNTVKATLDITLTSNQKRQPLPIL
jgi:hypothetical protein